MKRNLNEILFGLMLAWAGINCSDSDTEVDENFDLTSAESAIDEPSAKRPGLDKMALSYLCSEVEKKKHACKSCDKSFDFPSLLRAHERKHTGEKPFKCDICGTGYTRYGTLKEHLARKHSSGEKKYKCTVCEYAFVTSKELKEHGRVHTNERPFSCNMCPDTFKQWINLARHKVRFHRTRGKHKCEISDCDETFATRVELDTHKRMVHKIKVGIKCPHCCDKYYTNKSDLVKHIHAKHAEVSLDPVSVLSEQEVFRCMRCSSTFMTGEEEVAHRETCK